MNKVRWGNKTRKIRKQKETEIQRYTEKMCVFVQKRKGERKRKREVIER